MFDTAHGGAPDGLVQGLSPFSFGTQLALKAGQGQAPFLSQGMKGTGMGSLNWKPLPLHMGDQIMEELYFQCEDQVELWEKTIRHCVLLAFVVWR